MQYITGTTTASSSSGGLRVRSSKVTVDTSNVVGYLSYATQVEGWLDGDWIKIKYNGVDAYIAKAWVGNIQVIDPPTTPPSGKPSIEIVYDPALVDVTLKSK